MNIFVSLWYYLMKTTMNVESFNLLVKSLW